MDIRNRKALRREADAAVAANTGDPRLTLLVYVAVSLVGSLAIAILRTVLGNRIATTDAHGNVTYRTYDALGNVTAEWGAT